MIVVAIYFSIPSSSNKLITKDTRITEQLVW